MKNIAILVVLAAMASVGALVACGGSSPPPDSPANAPASSASAAPASSK